MEVFATVYMNLSTQSRRLKHFPIPEKYCCFTGSARPRLDLDKDDYGLFFPLSVALDRSANCMRDIVLIYIFLFPVALRA
jgi:hypothetical protein